MTLEIMIEVFNDGIELKKIHDLWHGWNILKYTLIFVYNEFGVFLILSCMHVHVNYRANLHIVPN